MIYYNLDVTYKNGNVVNIKETNLLDALNALAKCISDDAYVRFTDVYTFFDGYTHKTIKQNKYIHPLPALVSLLINEYTIKSVTNGDRAYNESFYESSNTYFDIEAISSLINRDALYFFDFLKIIYAEGAYMIELFDDGSIKEFKTLEEVKKRIDLSENVLSVNTDDEGYTYFKVKSITDNNSLEKILYTKINGFLYKVDNIYYSRIRNIMQMLVKENNIYRFNNIEFTLEEIKDVKDKYKFRSVDIHKYVTINFTSEAIEAFNYAGDIVLNGNMVFEKV